MSTEDLPSPGAPGAAPVAAPTRRYGRIALGGALLVLPLFVIPIELFAPVFTWSASNSALSLATSAAIFAMLAYSIGILLRFLALPSAGHGGLFGVGAYTSAIVMDRLGFGFELALISAILVTVGIGIVVGALALRTTGMAFLIITLALGELLVLIMLNWDGLTDGPLGMFATGETQILGVTVDSQTGRYVVALILLAVTVAAVWALSVSRFGRRLVAIRDNEPLARALGLNTFRHKLTAFLISAGIAGMAGHMYLINLKAITPDLFGALAVISVFLMVVMGGFKSLAGPAVGAWIVIFLPVWLEPLGLEDPTRQEIAFGGLLMAFMLLAPAGIMGGMSNLLDKVLGVESRPRFTLEPLTSRLRRSSHGRAEAPITRTEPAARAAAGTGEVLLECRSLSKRFRGVTAVDGLDLEVRRGEVVGIIGPNGSGKTTAVNCLTGFLPPSGGTVVWKGEDATDTRPDVMATRGLVRTFQEAMSFGEYSPREHCELVWRPPEAGGRQGGIAGIGSVDDVLELFSLTEVADVPASDLPYGQVSNVGLAAAVASGLPELLVLDEPAAGLSTVESEALRQRLLELCDRGLTILIIDHDMAFLMPMCDRVVVLDAGRRIASGTPAEVQRDPQVIAAYLGERFAAEGESVPEGGGVG